MLFSTEGIPHVRLLKNVRTSNSNRWRSNRDLSWYGLCKVVNVITPAKYFNLLPEAMLSHSSDKLNNDWIFIYKHNQRLSDQIAKSWLTDNHVNVVQWPTQIPSLNHIKHLWETVDKKIRKHNFTKRTY